MLITKEVLEEVTCIYESISGDDSGFSYMKLPVALKALGLAMKDVDNALIKESMASVSIDLTLFIRIVEDSWTKSNHMINEVNESFELFDRDRDEWLSAYDVMETFKKVTYAYHSGCIALHNKVLRYLHIITHHQLQIYTSLIHHSINTFCS
jgi:Ca2+-binding EF-hand superfamily protein